VKEGEEEEEEEEGESDAARAARAVARCTPAVVSFYLVSTVHRLAMAVLFGGFHYRASSESQVGVPFGGRGTGRGGRGGKGGAKRGEGRGEGKQGCGLAVEGRA
jgi:uncharacterized membrane protein YgcG